MTGCCPPSSSIATGGRARLLLQVVCGGSLDGEPPQAWHRAAEAVGHPGRRRAQVVPGLRADQARRRVSRTTKSSGRHSYCKPCHNARTRETKQRLYGGSREYHLRRRYGIGEKEFQELLAEQGGVCAICGTPDPQHLDHDHRTGWVRGILCFNCNGGLGQFRDDQSRLAGAITYLRGTTWQRVLIHPGVYQMCSPTRGRPPSPRS
ncbi:endonuclease VII domain-containing protein [Micromonospora echinofusca]|uniref:endonuclease VII domain-containing protein n=1 Tax=Micromonospora echinofusca TaxID=47858 RepID=UPI003424D603